MTAQIQPSLAVPMNEIINMVMKQYGKRSALRKFIEEAIDNTYEIQMIESWKQLSISHPTATHEQIAINVAANLADLILLMLKNQKKGD